MNYKGPIEAALSSDLRGEPHNFSLWDIHTGTQMVVFKGNKCNPIAKCLQLIDVNYFITAHDNVLNIWSISNRKCQDQKLFLPSRPSTLCTTPCGNFLIVGIAEQIYIWQLHSGNLLAHSQRHYQTVSVLKMNQDGTFLFSGGEDGLVLVWPFADLISNTHNTGALNLPQSRRDVGVNEPRFSWQHHSAQITDIHVTNGGRCLTASTDMTINIYSYADGKRLYCIAMPSPIWSITMDKNETRVFVGAQDGNIYEITVSSISLSLVNSSTRDEDHAPKTKFIGHKGKVVQLKVSTDGTRLISASIDSTCKIWDIQKKKMLQDIKHQAPLANLTSLLVPDTLALSSLTQSHAMPPLSFKALKRNLYKPPRDKAVTGGDLFDEASTTIVHVKNTKNIHQSLEEENGGIPPVLDMMNLRRITNGSNPTSKSLQSEGTNGESLNSLKQKLRDLYLLSAEKIFCDAANESLKTFESIVKETNDESKTSKSARKRKRCY